MEFFAWYNFFSTAFFLLSAARSSHLSKRWNFLYDATILTKRRIYMNLLYGATHMVGMSAVYQLRCCYTESVSVDLVAYIYCISHGMGCYNGCRAKTQSTYFADKSVVNLVSVSAVREDHVHLCISLWANLVPPINRRWREQRSIHRSPLLFRSAPRQWVPIMDFRFWLFEQPLH